MFQKMLHLWRTTTYLNIDTSVIPCPRAEGLDLSTAFTMKIWEVKAYFASQIFMCVL